MRGRVSVGMDLNPINTPGASKVGTYAVSLKDRTTKMICAGICLPKWSPDGLFLYVTTSTLVPTVSGIDPPTSAGQALVFPIPRGQDLPSIPEGGVGVNAIDVNPGIRVIRQGQMVPGPDPQTYAFAKSEFMGNLFRIPLTVAPAGRGKGFNMPNRQGEIACPTTDDQPFAKPGGAGIQPADSFFLNFNVYPATLHDWPSQERAFRELARRWESVQA